MAKLCGGTPQGGEAGKGQKMEYKIQRSIFAKLNEVYGDNAYKTGWTDGKVAADLGVSRSQVAEVRAYMFGPASVNHEVRAILDEAKKLRDEAKQAANLIAADIAGMVKEHQTFGTRIRTLEAKIVEIEKQL